MLHSSAFILPSKQADCKFAGEVHKTAMAVGICMEAFSSPALGSAKHKGLPGIVDIVRDLRQTFLWLLFFGRIPWVFKSHPL